MSEPKKPSKPMADVAKPGKSAPSATSKPVIVTNRPILKDPMVTGEKSEGSDDGSEKIIVKTSSHSTIEPLGAPPVAEDKKKADDKKPALAEPEPVIEEIAKKDPVADKDKSGIPDEEAKPETDAAPPPKTPDKEVAPEPEKKAPETTSSTSGAQEAAPPAITTPETESTAQEGESGKSDNTAVEALKAEEAKAAEQAKHDATIQKLVDNKQYFLPINAVEQRRTKRFIALGIIVSLLLVVAWADIALDAGLVHISNVKPVTHFFSN